jgi:hypothetical protein
MAAVKALPRPPGKASVERRAPTAGKEKQTLGTGDAIVILEGEKMGTAAMPTTGSRTPGKKVHYQ